ncbi:MAG: hypothetical protein R3F60_04585 [bacterium]
MGAEVVLILELGTASDVTVTMAEADGRRVQGSMYVRTACEDARSELACARGADPALVVQELPAGRYFVFLEQGFVAAAMARSVDVEVLPIIGECNDEVDNDGEAWWIGMTPAASSSGIRASWIRPASPRAPTDRRRSGRRHRLSGRLGLRGGRGSARGGCRGNPQWEPVRCAVQSWVGATTRQFQTMDCAAAARALWTGLPPLG